MTKLKIPHPNEVRLQEALERLKKKKELEEAALPKKEKNKGKKK